MQGYNEEILDLCDLDVIDKEIEESDEANSKIVEILAEITEISYLQMEKIAIAH